MVGHKKSYSLWPRNRTGSSAQKFFSQPKKMKNDARKNEGLKAQEMKRSGAKQRHGDARRRNQITALVRAIIEKVDPWRLQAVHADIDAALALDGPAACLAFTYNRHREPEARRVAAVLGLALLQERYGYGWV